MLSSKDRRIKVVEQLKKSKGAITGSELAKLFDVSRQVIVQDIAILKAAGQSIISTPQGYIINISPSRKTSVIVSNHTSLQEMEDELNIIVDMGGKVLDVTVEHPIYGNICAQLMISSRYDVQQFVKKVVEYSAEPLSKLTGGVHLHTIEADKEEILHNIEVQLKQKGYAIDN